MYKLHFIHKHISPIEVFKEETGLTILNPRLCRVKQFPIEDGRYIVFLFFAEWQRKIGASITDTGNALEFDEAVTFGKGINILALRDYMITVGKNTRCILEDLTLTQIQSMVPEEWVMRSLNNLPILD